MYYVKEKKKSMTVQDGLICLMKIDIFKYMLIYNIKFLERYRETVNSSCLWGGPLRSLEAE